MPRILQLVPLALALLLAPLTAQAAPQRHVLPNGLTVILSENHEAPVAAFQVWVKAGSAYEEPHEYGITHLIEHMIFKGAPGLPAGEMARRIEALGGEVNAYTTLDHTNYFLAAASADASEMLTLLAQAVVNASFDPLELEAEKEVVVEEIRMNGDDPGRRRSKELMALAFGDHAYGRPVIGTEDSVRAISREHILAFRQRWYRAPNMVVVAVGDFEAKAMLPAIEQAFAGLPRGQVPAFALPPLPAGGGPRLKIMREKVSQAAVSLAWRAPGLPSEEVYPMDVAAFLAGEGRASRLHAELKERRGLVDAVEAGNYTPEGVGLFEVEARLAPAKVAQAWPALLEEALSLANRPPAPEELKRARVGLTAEYVRGRQTMAAQARLLGYFEMLRGGFEKSADYLDRYRAVDAAQVVETARRHLRPENLAMVVQLPEGAPAPELAQVQAQLQQLMARPSAQIPPRQAAAHKLVLENGLTLLVKPQRAVPLVAMVMATPGGQAGESAAKAGLHHLWSTALTRGTGQRGFEQLTAELEGMAASLEGFSSRGAVGVAGSFLAKDWRRGLELLAEVWSSPTFPPEQVERARAEQAARLRAQEDSPTSRALKQFRKLLYGDHPYGQDPLGTPQTLAGLSRDDLVALHSRLRGPGGAVLCLVGEVEPEDVAREAARLLGGLKGQTQTVAPPPLGPIASPRQEKISDPKAQQTQIILGHLAPSATDPGRWPLRLAEAMLGGQGGRLFVDLRDRQSLAYAVQPFYTPSWHAGVFGVFMAVGPGKEAQALAGLAGQLSRLASQDPTPQEMARALSYILGQEAIAMQAYAAQAMTMTVDELLGLGYDHHLRADQHLKAVTPAQVRQAAAKVLPPQSQALLTLGP